MPLLSHFGLTGSRKPIMDCLLEASLWPTLNPRPTKSSRKVCLLSHKFASHRPKFVTHTPLFLPASLRYSEACASTLPHTQGLETSNETTSQEQAHLDKPTFPPLLGQLPLRKANNLGGENTFWSACPVHKATTPFTNHLNLMNRE